MAITEEMTLQDSCSRAHWDLLFMAGISFSYLAVKLVAHFRGCKNVDYLKGLLTFSLRSPSQWLWMDTQICLHEKACRIGAWVDEDPNICFSLKSIKLLQCMKCCLEQPHDIYLCGPTLFL